MERAGLVGAGRMGLAMIRHLVAGGFTVTATDTSAEAQRGAGEAGAVVVATAADVAAASDVVFLAVGFDDEAAAACHGENGVFSGAREGTLIVLNSTVAPDLARALAIEAAGRGLKFLDVPIARGADAAVAGTLLALAGGDSDTLEAARPMLSTFCSDIAHVGDVGHGQVAKAINNLLLWVDGVALIEAGRLAASTGIDLPHLRETLLMSSGQSWALENWDSVRFTWALKDMQIVMDMCDQAGGAFPLLGFVKEQVKAARASKLAEDIGWTGKGDKR